MSFYSAFFNRANYSKNSYNNKDSLEDFRISGSLLKNDRKFQKKTKFLSTYNKKFNEKKPKYVETYEERYTILDILSE